MTTGGPCPIMRMTKIEAYEARTIMTKQQKGPKRPPGRPRLHKDLLKSTAIKLPRWQVQYLENGSGKGQMSAKLRDIMERMTLYGADIVLPPDPGPGVTERRSFKIPPELLEDIKRFARGKGYTVAIRRGIAADASGILPKRGTGLPPKPE